MFIVALFVIFPNYKQPRYPPAVGQVIKLWCIYTMGYHNENGQPTIVCNIMNISQT